MLRWADAFPLADHQRAVGKLVRRDHVKTDQHWMHGEVVANGACPRRLSGARRAPTCASTGCRGSTRWPRRRRARSGTARATSSIHTRMVADGLLRDERHQALDDERADGAVARGAAARRRQAGHDALRERSLPRARPCPARRDHRPPAAVGGGDRAGGARADLRARPPPHGPASPDRARGADPQLHRDLARGRRVPPVPADARRRARADRRRRRRAGDQRRAVRRVRARPRLPGRAVPVRLRPRALQPTSPRRPRPGLRRARRHAQPRRRPVGPAGLRARTCGSPATATAARSSRSTTYVASAASSAGTRRGRAG